VYGLIHDMGLERFYSLRRGPGFPPLPPRTDDFPWLDALMNTEAAEAVKPLVLALDIQGIHCAACVWILESLFRNHAAGMEIRINPALGKVALVWNPALGDLREWLREAEAFGYRFAPDRAPSAQSTSRSLLVRLGIAVAAAMNVMIFTLCYYLGLDPTDGVLYPLFGWLNLGLAAAAVAAGGWVFFRAAALGLRRGLVHLDLPIAFGILLAFAGSVIEHLRHGPEAAYYDTVTIFIALMLLGRWLQERVLERNRNALLAVTGIDPMTVRRFRDGELESVPAASVSAGDEIWAVPGDTVPVRSILIEHPGWLRMDWITGESDERRALPGEPVPAGAMNAGRTALRLSAQEPFAASRLHQLLAAPSPSAEMGGRGWWRRVSLIYVIAVFALSALGFVLWLGHGADRALQVAVAVLVVTCPCALGLAVPLAHEMTHLALRRRGVFLRGRGFLDRALAVRKVVFDKTGTLTRGRLALDDASAAALRGLAPGHRGALRTLAAQSNHPVARTLAEAMEREGADTVASENGIHREPEVTETPGQGLSVTWAGRTYRLGRRAFAVSGGGAPSENGLHGNASARKTDARETGAGNGDDAPDTEAVFSVDGDPVAAFRFAERLKEDARQEVDRLRDAGYALYLASGDVEARVRSAARELEIPADHARAGMTPEDKAAWIRELDAGDTLMVGDGLNDAPGLDAAACTATPAVDHPSLPGRADFYFLGSGIGAVREALFAARRLRRVVRGNLAVALVYNAGALAACYLGLVTPVVAAVLMPASSILVVSLTARRLSRGNPAWTF
jgi:Cu2+-exporting ATPase